MKASHAYIYIYVYAFMIYAHAYICMHAGRTKFEVRKLTCICSEFHPMHEIS
jgi:hypothetical protein